MLISRDLKVGKKTVQSVEIKLGAKNLIALIGQGGYVICGYLNLEVANKFKDVAVIVTGVESIEDVLKSKAQILSDEAKKIGLREGQSIKDVLKVIA